MYHYVHLYICTRVHIVQKGNSTYTMYISTYVTTYILYILCTKCTFLHKCTCTYVQMYILYENETVHTICTIVHMSQRTYCTCLCTLCTFVRNMYMYTGSEVAGIWQQRGIFKNTLLLYVDALKIFLVLPVYICTYCTYFGTWG